MSDEGIRSNLVQYVQGGPEKAQSFLFTPEEAIQAAERAIDRIRSIYTDTKIYRDWEVLYQSLILISTNYHNDYSWFKRENGAKIRQEILDISQATEKLVGIIKDSKIPRVRMIFLQALDKALHKSSLTVTGRAPSADAERFLDALLNMDVQVPSPAKRGKPANDHIKAAARRLIQAYETWSGERYRKTLDHVPGRGGGEFISAGPNFVWLALWAIDPQLKFSEVRSALKELPIRKSPENTK